jgi:hypothetical protein
MLSFLFHGPPGSDQLFRSVNWHLANDELPSSIRLMDDTGKFPVAEYDFVKCTTNRVLASVPPKGMPQRN